MRIGQLSQKKFNTAALLLSPGLRLLCMDLQWGRLTQPLRQDLRLGP